MSKLAIEAHPTPRRRILWPWLALYPIAWAALFAGSSIYWFLPAGLRLGALWLLPRRAWWMLALVEWLGILALSLARGAFQSLPGLVSSTVLPWCIYALVLRGIGRHGRERPTREVLPRLLATGLLAAIFTTVALTAIDLNDDGVLPASLAATLVSYALGDFAGIVIMVPLLLVLHDQARPSRLPWRALLADGLVLVPLAVALGLSALPALEAPVYPLLLSLFPAFGLAYRFGWRPATVALGLLSIGVHAIAEPVAQLWGPGQMQLLVAVIGSAVLLLGVASETQQQQRSELSATVQALSMRGTQLVEAANRIASLQEQERRRIGAELHDQIGQDMTAIATRLRVVERTAVDPDVRDGLASIRALVNDAHAHLREVINSLHPAVLDRFGLARALAEGPFAEMLADHDIDYSCQIDGDVDALPDNIASALYRICQEATTNCAKHGCGQRVYIHLTLLPRVGGAELALQIGDYAGRLDIDTQHPGRGLLNIRDRADAIGARYDFNAESGSPRHAVQMWVPQAAFAGVPS
ncbi:histidine kinase [Lysobacter koreensis]|uniref:Histidine kinase n=1 Tax=Lysobacter koreensis TaxID=266122 RepID=A0ABW2YJ71_9GAMM